MNWLNGHFTALESHWSICAAPPERIGGTPNLQKSKIGHNLMVTLALAEPAILWKTSIVSRYMKINDHQKIS